MVLAFAILYKVQNQYLTVLVSAFVTGSLNQYRGDREFVRLQFPRPALLFTVEYLIVSLPFFVISLAKCEWIQAIVILTMATVFPHIRQHHLSNQRLLPLPFLYRGGINMLYTVRQVWWGLPLLLIAAVEGSIEHNENLIKVCIALWTILLGFIGKETGTYIVHYKSFAQLIKENTKMVLCDVSLLIIPLLGVLLYESHDIVQMLTFFVAGIMFVECSVLFRYATSNPVMWLIHSVLLFFSYIISIMLGWGLLLFILISAIDIIIIHGKYHFLWK